MSAATTEETIAATLRTAFATGDPTGLAGLLADDVQWLGAEPGPHDCHNREDVLATLRRNHNHGVHYRLIGLQRTDRHIRLHLAAAYDEPDSGEHHQWDVRQVLVLDHDGRVTRIQDDPEAPAEDSPEPS